MPHLEEVRPSRQEGGHDAFSLPAAVDAPGLVVGRSHVDLELLHGGAAVRFGPAPAEMKTVRLGLALEARTLATTRAHLQKRIAARFRQKYHAYTVL